MTKRNSLMWLMYALVLLQMGCATKEKQQETVKPDWLVGHSQSYQNSLYLLGKGIGANLEAANQNARVELAENFEVKVVEASHDVQTVSMEDNLITESRSQTERSINTYVNQILTGVQIADTWQDPQTQQYYALATLNRMNAASALRQDIAHLDELTARHIKNAQQQIDRLRIASHAQQAFLAQLERTELQKKLRVIDLTGEGIPAQVELAKLKTDYEQVLGRIHIVCQADDPNVQQLLSAGISQAGFNADPRQPVRYALTATVERVPVIVRDGFYWLHAALNLQLKEKDTGDKIRGAERWEIKVSATDENLLEKRLQDELNKLTHQKMRAMILNFASPEK